MHQLLLYPLKRIDDVGQNRLETACNPMWYYFAYNQFENDDKISIARKNKYEIKVLFYQHNLIKEWIRLIIFSNNQLNYSMNLFYFLCCLASIETKTDQQINNILETEGLSKQSNSLKKFTKLDYLTKLHYLNMFIEPKFKTELINNILDSSFKQILNESGFRLIQNDNY